MRVGPRAGAGAIPPPRYPAAVRAPTGTLAITSTDFDSNSAAKRLRYDRRPEDAKCEAAKLVHVPYTGEPGPQ